MKSLLAGTFFVTAVAGFAADLAQLNVRPLGRGLFWPVLFGAAAVGALISSIKRVRPVFLIFIVILVPWLAGGLSGLGWMGLGWLAYPISLLATPWPVPQSLKSRVLFDAIGTLIAGGFGFRLLLSFVSEAEYALAGHLPILHYRHQHGDTTRLSIEQFPLGLLPGGSYASQRVNYSPGDLFLLFTDGITEIANEQDEEFGLARLERLLCQHAAQPLPQIWEMVMREVKLYGAQQDDQSLLLLRVRR
jgi:hypothetical protein